MKKAIVQVLMKTGGAINFIHTEQDAHGYYRAWTDRDRTKDKEGDMSGLTLDKVYWAIGISDIAGLVILPHQQQTLPSPGTLGQSINPFGVGLMS